VTARSTFIGLVEDVGADIALLVTTEGYTDSAIASKSRKSVD
jgi:hypothetical protein